MRAARNAFVFALNAIVAAVAPGALEAPLVHRLGPILRRSSAPFVWVEVFAAVTGFGLGYFIYRRWRPAPARWVWTAAVCAFVGRLLWRIGEGNAYRVVLHEMLGDAPRTDAQGFLDWIEVTIPCVRTTFYSVGAFCCSKFGEHGPTIATRLLDRALGLIQQSWRRRVSAVR